MRSNRPILFDKSISIKLITQYTSRSTHCRIQQNPSAKQSQTKHHSNKVEIPPT